MVEPNKKVLDVGCATGRIAEKLKKEKKCFVVGIEINEAMAKIAEKRCDKVIVANVESLKLIDFPKKYFDILLFADVLEHCQNPGEILQNLRGYLSDNGYILISVPNVANWEIRLKLLCGRFDYKGGTILDDGHLKFFTLNSIKRLIEQSGFKVVEVRTRNAVLKHLGRLWKTLFGWGFVIRAKKSEINAKKQVLKRVLLIDPKGFGAGLNLGLGYLAAVLLKNEYRVKVLDFNNDSQRLAKSFQFKLGIVRPETWDKRVDRVSKWEPNVIGISINSFTLENALGIIKYCRSKIGDRAKYVVGGPHVTMFRKDFLEKNKDLFDFAVVGEGEETIIDLLKNIKNPKKVKGIIYYDLKKNQLIETKPRSLINNLDSIPFPNFEVFDSVMAGEGLFNYQMTSSRGCPYGCVFCFHMWTRRWRARSPENILEEIKFAKKRFHFKTLTFWDDNFTLDLDRAKKICDLFLAEKLDLKYSLAGLRADRIDEELIEKLKKSGCIGIAIGIEDGDPSTFPLVGKGETLEDIKKAVRLIQRYNIPLLAYMVTGLINSSYKSFLCSLKFVENLGVTAHWSIAFPFPDTPLYDWAKENGRFFMKLEEGFKLSMTNKNPPVVFDTAVYPKEERLKAYYLGNLRCGSYDMVMKSRNDNVFRQAIDIAEAIWKYDREKWWGHFLNLSKVFLKFMQK